MNNRKKRINSKKLEFAVKYHKTLEEVASEYDIAPDAEIFMQFLEDKGFSSSAAKHYVGELVTNSDAAAKKARKCVLEATVDTTTNFEEKIEINSVDQMLAAFEKYDVSNLTVLEAAEELGLNLEIKTETVQKKISESEKVYTEILSEIEQLFEEIDKKKEALKSCLQNKVELNSQLDSLANKFSIVHSACEHRRKMYNRSNTILIVDTPSIEGESSNEVYGKILIAGDLLSENGMLEKVAQVQDQIMQCEMAEDLTVKEVKAYAKYIAIVASVQKQYPNSIVDHTFTGIDQLLFDQLLSLV